MKGAISFGDRTYRLVAVRHDARWIAHAERMDSGDRFGIECADADPNIAMNRLTAWLSWQYEHTNALDALQESERAYHRLIAGSALASPSEGPTAIEHKREWLEALDRARTRLDEVRSRKPE
jgi:hypothetical protein